MLYLYGVIPNSDPDYRGPYGEWMSYFTVSVSAYAYVPHKVSVLVHLTIAR